MKKVLALVLAVVMVCGMAAIATSAAKIETVDAKLVFGGNDAVKTIANDNDIVTVEAGEEFTVTLKPNLGDEYTLSSKVAFKVKVEKDEDNQKSYVELVKQDGYKFTFRAVSNPTTPWTTDKKTTITFSASDNGSIQGVKTFAVVTGVNDNEIVAKEVFENAKEANENNPNVKASVAVGDYLTVTNVNVPAAVNKKTVSAPAAVVKAMEGKNYVFAGYKYAQNLPGVGTMKVSLNAPLMLNNPKGVYVYQYSDGKLTLYPSTAEDKTWAVKDGAVEFPVSTTAQWVVTDKQITSSNTSNNTNTNTNPGTGANDMIGAAVVMALVAAAGVVAFKK